MGFYQGLPLVCSLGITDVQEGLLVTWPSGVVSPTGQRIAELRVSGGYDAEGVYAKLIMWLSPSIPADKAERSILSRVDAWASDIAAGRGAAGPLAPVLSELFDRMYLMGCEVMVQRPDGLASMTSVLCGIDAWGRATVRDRLGNPHELAPEQAVIRRP